MKGLRVVHKLREYDAEMGWLAELFPLEEGTVVAHDVAERRLVAWCASHPDDGRGLRYLADLRGDRALLEKAALLGDACAMVCLASSLSDLDERKFQLAKAAAEKGDADGTYWLACSVRDGVGCKRDQSLAAELLERAAELGSFWAFDSLLKDESADAALVVKLTVSFLGVYSVRSVLRCSGDGSPAPCHGRVVRGHYL